MIYRVQMQFKAKSGEIRKGQLIAMAEDYAATLLRAGKITEFEACYVCHSFSWWLSIYGAVVCSKCHPPATMNIVKRWIGNQSEYISQNCNNGTENR